MFKGLIGLLETVENLTIREALRLVSSKLSRAGFDSPWSNAEVLLAFALNCSRFEIYADSERALDSNEAGSLAFYLEKRLGNVPLQYITGRQNFRYLNLKVEPGVFIPRPETELLAGCVIDFIRAKKSPLVVDLGTGSGAIALSIAYEVPQASVIAVDVCSKALAVASDNARESGLENRVSLLRSDLFENLDDWLKGNVDAIVANPPYILPAEIGSLPREVRCFEPIKALDGGEGGLSIITRIISGAGKFIGVGGLLAIEVGHQQARDVADIIKASCKFSNINIMEDYASIERIVTGTFQA